MKGTSPVSSSTKPIYRIHRQAHTPRSCVLLSYLSEGRLLLFLLLLWKAHASFGTLFITVHIRLMNSMQHCRRMITASSQANIVRHLARSLPTSKTTTAGTVISNSHCPPTHAASAVGGVSTSQEPPVSHQDWDLPPLARIQNAVDRFRQEQYIDELPSRTQKSVVEAAAAGKGYITPEDITRVMANIAGRNVLSAGEAETICNTWGEKPPVEAMATPSISTATFLRLLEASPK